MQRLAYLLLLLFQLCLAEGALTACQSGSDEPEGQTDFDQKPTLQLHGTYFTLTLTAAQPSATASRSPLGGEDGDGRDWGYERERKVTDATLLFYQDQNGINGDENTPITYALYATSFTNVTDDSGITQYTTGLLHADEPFLTGHYHVIVLANMGNQQSLKGHTLGEVRNMLCTRLYDQTGNDPTTATHFAMTSTKDADVTIEGEGGADNPIHVGPVNIGRLAARIDFSTGDASAQGGTLVPKITLTPEGATQSVTLTNTYRYTIYQSTDNKATSDCFYLCSVTPFNLQASGVQLIRRVSQATDGTQTIQYLGTETTDAQGMATNFVLDPWTSLKGQTAVEGLAYTYPYGQMESLSDAEAWPLREPDPLNTDGRTAFSILTYAQENTLSLQSNKERFATGIMMRGYYGKHQADGSYTYSEKTYYYFIRHADPNHTSADNVPMKYGIVRNNIYRIRINRVTALGIIMLEVRDWTPIRVPEIEM